jgi:hypothetical protein
MTEEEYCVLHAESAEADAGATNLDNVRDRFLRSASVWRERAERARRVAISRAQPARGGCPTG